VPRHKPVSQRFRVRAEGEVARATRSWDLFGVNRAERAILIGLVVATGVSACDDRDDARVGHCEQSMATLTIRTIDGQPTIARVDLEPSTPPRACTTSSPCGPMFEADAGSAACSELDVVSWGAEQCTVPLTSVAGQVVNIEARVKAVPGGDRKCRDDRGYLRDVVQVAFDPPGITVDFSVP
jgi:hypothetical protein